MRFSFVTVAASSVVMLVAGAANASPADACIDAAERGQASRDAGRLLDARAGLAGCASSSCPALIQRDCVKWIDDVAARIPSIIVRSRIERGDDVPAAVSIDGRSVSARLDGRQIELDPGNHVIRFEREGAPPIERTILLVERERGRLVEAVWPAVETPTPSRVPAAPEKESREGPPPVSWVLGGIGVAGLASFTVFGLRARSGFDDLDGTCAPGCAPNEVDAVRRDALVANISLGIGIAALVAGGVLWLTHHSTR